MLEEPSNKQSLIKGNNKAETSSERNTQPTKPPTVDNQRMDKSSIRESAKTEAEAKKKKKQKETQFTTVLKVFNLVLGLGVITFGVCCYKFAYTTENTKLDYIGIILPGYIALSGLIIVLIECNLKFMIRNMRFLYNFLGRGMFNIYVGVMPLCLVNSEEGSSAQPFEIIIYVISILLVLIGVLYIISKIFCCAKQDLNKKKRRARSDSDQSDSS